MADYFTYFSVVVPLMDTRQQQYALDLAGKAAAACFRDEGEPASAEIPAELLDVLEDWHFETEKDENHSIWLHSQDGGIDAVCAFIQHLLKKFNLEGRVEFEWSHDCSRPRVDAYGGGAAIVTAQEIQTMSTSAWLQREAGGHE